MILEDIKYLSKFPPKIIVKRIINKGFKVLKDRQIKRKVSETEIRGKQKWTIPFSYLNIQDIDLSGLDIDTATYLVDQYVAHRFNLLGSGWVRTDYSAVAPGLEDIQFYNNLDLTVFDSNGDWLAQVVKPIHLDTSKKYWQIVAKTNSNYQAVDWQKDFKSGFRWDAKQWYKVQYSLMNNQEGIDLKVPWELTRFQHLPQMAVFAKLLPERRTELIKEFKCQTLDFFATNPTSMGVNFKCAMDVGIRSANLCLAYDLFVQLDEEKEWIDSEFEAIFSENLYLHGRHILEDLEYNEGVTSNHYLGNIAGLLYIGAYLPIEKEIDQWLAFSIQEFIHSLEGQYFEDGGNFEASTAYHRLSSEMMIFSTALAMGLGVEKRNAINNYSTSSWKEKAPLLTIANQQFDTSTKELFPKKYLEKLYKTGLFGKGIRKDSEEIIQFGDNDSGRFLRLSPNGMMMTTAEAVNKYQNLDNYGKQYTDPLFWEENDLNIDTFLSAIGGLYESADFELMERQFPLETSIIKGLAQQTVIISPIANNTILKSKDALPLNKANYPYQVTTKLGEKEYRNVAPFTKNLELKIFPDFQLYIFKSDRIYLAIGGVSSKQQHPSGSHVHNDSLSIELAIDGKDLIVDPGTYLYTPIPARRFLFKSTAVHNTLIVEGEEQNPSLKGRIGLFSVNHDTNISLIDYDENSISIGLKYRHIQQVRKVTIQKEAIVIADYSNVPFKQHFNRFELYSNGYGKRIH